MFKIYHWKCDRPQQVGEITKVGEVWYTEGDILDDDMVQLHRQDAQKKTQDGVLCKTIIVSWSSQNKRGKFIDSPENRALVAQVANSKACYTHTDTRGNLWYTMPLGDTEKLYIYTRKKEIKGAEVVSIQKVEQ